MRTILQIVPATGCESVYNDGDDRENIVLPVILWALCEEDDGTRVVESMSLGTGNDYMELDREASNFLGVRVASK